MIAPAHLESLARDLSRADALSHTAAVCDPGCLRQAIASLRAVALAAERIGPWLSAAIDDPAVCAEMRADALAWLEAATQTEGEA